MSRIKDIEARAKRFEALKRKLPTRGTDPIGSFLRKLRAYRSDVYRRCYNNALYQYLSFRWPLYEMWRWRVNRVSKQLYRRERDHMSLGRLQRRIVDELTEKGIATVKFNDLFPSESFAVLRDSAEMLMRAPATLTKIEAVKAGVKSVAEFKFYLVHLLGEHPTLELKNDFLDISLSDEIQRVVCAYLGMFARLVQIELWCNVPTVGPDTYSQRWHRDPDDRRIVKLFLYLRDVDKPTGPFCYIPGSHNSGPLHRILPQTMNTSRYPADDEIARRFSEDQIQVCTGEAGTLIFCDTSGLHRGGHPTTGSRVLFHCVYTTNAGVAFNGKRYSITPGNRDSLSPAAQYAIGHL